MPNSQTPTPTPSSAPPTTRKTSIYKTAIMCDGQIDPSIKINPAALRRLEESSKGSSNVAPSTRNTSSSSIASSATLYAPSVSGTTLQDTDSEPRPRTFKTGHGVCCNADLMKRCLEHGEAGDVDGGGAGGHRVGEEVDASAEVIDRVISGYTGPTNTEPKTEEEREAGRERRRARLARIQ